MNLILIDRHELAQEDDVRLDGVRARHIREVLRAGPGQHLRVGLVDGPRGDAEVRSIDNDAVTLRCVFETTPPPRPRLDLLLALPRPKILRRLWPQIAALGVGHVALTNAERVERDYFDSHIVTPASYRPLLLEGLQQARDTQLPTVSVHKQFRKLVERELGGLSDAGHRLVADPSAATTIEHTLGSTAVDRVLLAVGPEGGWNTFELELLTAHGFVLVGLGTRTLRTDTACVALLALVHAALDER